MISVKELREMTQVTELGVVETKMKAAANNGKYYVRLTEWLQRDTKEKLKEYGYDVSHDDGDTIISWSRSGDDSEY